MEAELIRTTPTELIQALDLIHRMQFVDALALRVAYVRPLTAFQKPYREFESHPLHTV